MLRSELWREYPYGGDLKAYEVSARSDRHGARSDLPLRRLADDHKHPRAAVAYGRCLEHGLGVRAVDEAAALKYFSQAAAQTRRATAEVDVAAREAGQAAAYSLMQRMHLRKAREGLGATQRAAAAAGVTSTGGRFAAKVVHTEKARAEEE